MVDEVIYSGDEFTDSGLTITGEVYDVTGTQVGSDVTMTEVGSLAFYRGDMPTASAGKYYIRFISAGALQAQIVFYWDGTAEITEQTINSQLADVQTDLEIRIDDAALIPR